MAKEYIFLERLTELRLEGKTRKFIASELGITVSIVKRLISKHKIVPRKTKQEEEEALPPVKKMDENEGIGLMDQVKFILGPRMGMDYRGYLLDGVPCSSDRLVRESGLTYKNRKNS